jgi:outer membrane lipoprotein-sorting protein
MEQLDGGRITANIDLATLQMGAQLDDRTFRPDFPRDAAIVDIR